MPKPEDSISQSNWKSVPSPGPSSQTSSRATISRFIFRAERHDSPPVVDEYGDYKSDSQLYFTERLYVTRKWSMWITVVFVILTWSGLIVAAQRIPLFNVKYDIRCRIPDLEKTNWTYNQIKKISSYRNASSRCYYYDYDYKNLSQLCYSVARNITKNSPRPPIRKCTDYLSNVRDQGQTYRDEFGMECMPKHYDFLQYAEGGQIIGYVITGLTADIYGRRSTLIGAQFVFVVGCLLTVISPTYWFLNLSIFLVKGGSGSVANISLILFLEIVHYKIRMYTVAVLRLGFGIGCFLHVVLRPYVKQWRHYQWAANCTLLLPILTQWLLPESPHWLLCNKHWRRMEEVLNEMNYPKCLPPNEIYHSNKPLKVITVKEIAKVLLKPKFYKKLILGAFSYSLIYFLYFTENRRIIGFINSELKFYSVLGFSMIVNMAIVPIMLRYFGRPMCICLSLLLLALFYCSFTIYQPYPGVGSVISCVCLTIVQTATVVNRLLIIEMFPTRVRATALSICRSMGSLFVLCSSIIENHTDIEKSVASFGWTIYASVMLVTAFICTLVSNTGNVPLPDTELQAIIHY